MISHKQLVLQEKKKLVCERFYLRFFLYIDSYSYRDLLANRVLLAGKGTWIGMSFPLTEPAARNFQCAKDLSIALRHYWKGTFSELAILNSNKRSNRLDTPFPERY